jgi:quinol-cytochrome oxidoreductase complex cytochrome b subunit
MYSTTGSLSIAYNAGAAALMLYLVQLTSGVLMVMSYSATEEAFMLLDSFLFCSCGCKREESSVAVLLLSVHHCMQESYEC